MSDTEAVAEASLCLQCGGPSAPAPCTVACPAAIDIPGFIRNIADGLAPDAARKIFSANVLGGSCSRVCPVDVLCQGSCVLRKEGRQAIQIGRLQRFATDQAFASGLALAESRSRVRLGQTVGVVGAGPAGLACAAELARLGYPVTVYEQRERPGGLVVHGIAPYKQTIEPLPAEVEAIRDLGVRFEYGVAIGHDLSAREVRERHEAIFLGVGMGEDLPARIPGEDLPGVWDSLAFVEALKLGEPPPINAGTRVAVIGGGNTAIDVAREAAMLGAAKVQMLYRRGEEHMPAYRHEVEAARREGVTIVPLVAPVELLGWERARGVRCVRMRLGAPDSSGRPRPEPIPGSEFVVDADMVIKAIGQRPRTELFSLFGIELARGVVELNRDFQTSDPDIFAGGDCVNGGATVVEAVRDGRRAALAIDRYLTGQPRARARERPPSSVHRDNGTVRHLQGDYRLNTAPALCKGCSVCVTSCPAETLELNAARQIVVKDVGACVFCGVCEARCPDFAIWMAKGAMPRALPPVESPQGSGVSA